MEHNKKMKSKRIILNIAILLLTIVFASSISVFVSAKTADTNTPTIFIGDSTVVAGKTIDVDILLLNSPGVASVIIDVTFDEELLTLKSINFGEEFESGSDLPQTFASPIRLSWADLDNMVGDLSFATLTFEAKKNISKDCLTEICVEYASSNIINLEEEPVFFDVHNGKLTVNIGYPGDINGDGEVNAKDLLRLRKYFAGWDVQVDETAVDVNGDGEVNAKDLLRLRKYFAGWEVEIFYGTKSNLKCAHLMEKTSATPATCTETGNSEYWYCSVCDKYFSDAEGETEITLASTVIPAKGHTPGEAVIENRVEPTCTKKGSYDEVVYCTVCGEELSRTTKEIDANGHTMTATAAKDATCTEAGNTAYWYCSVCDKYFSDAEGKNEIAVNSWIIPAKGHTPGEAVIENRVEPTCTEKGSYDEVVYCTTCGDELSRTHKETAALGHTMTATAAKDATCTEAGNTAYWYCNVCDKYFSDAEGETEITLASTVIPAKGHTSGEAVIENRVEPTCTEKGSYDEVIYCTVCGDEVSRTHKEIAALGHTMTATAAKAASCTEAGNTAYWHCSVCDKYFSDAEGKNEIAVNSWIIPAKGHTPGEAVIENRVEPTCTEKGSYDEVVYCTVCGDEVSRTHKEIVALGHTMTATAAKDATCTEAGNTAYWYCSECGKYFSDAEGKTEITLASTVIPAKGHTSGEAVIESRVDPTCTEKGSYDEVVYCTTCGDELSRTHKEIAALGHTLTATAAKDATCTEAGNTAYWYCSECDKYFSDANGENEIAENSWIIPAKGHTPGEAVIENRVEPTCTEKGSYDEVVYCTVCGDELSRTHKEIAALGHTLTATAAKDATCTEAGNTAYWYCSECGKYFSDAEGKTEITLASTVIPATGHSFSKAWTIDDDYHWHVSTCGHDVVSDKTEHTFENGFCTVCKLGQKIVENGIKYQYGKENKETVLTVIAYEGNASEVVVPATVNGVRVSVINAHVFEGEQFTKITIPASLEYFGHNAIYNCPNLTEIAVVDEGYYFAENNMIMYKDGPRVDEGEVRLCYVPDGITGEVIIPGIVTDIGADAFDNCVGITSVHIPSSVKISCEFGVYGSNDSAFSNCPNLTTIYGYAGACAETVASNNNIDFVAYSEGLAYTSNGDGTCAVTGIGDCTDTDIVIPPISLDGNTVTGIGDYAFQNCNGITSVTMPSSVTSMGNYALQSCRNLTSVKISSSVTNIGWYALSFCNKLTEINVDENNTNYSSVNGVLYNKAQTMLICYPEGKTETSFTILASVTSIKDGAFSGCSYLTAITADENNEYYSSVNGVLYNKDQTMIVYVPSVVSGNFVIPSNVSVIGNNAFAWCTKITNVTIQEGVTTISSNAFSGCSSLKSITIPDGVTSIGSYAFNQCSKLSRIILPASLKNISIGAFQKCSQLDSVYYLGTDEQWAEITIGSNNDPLINAGYARTYTYNGFIYANITVSDTPSCIILGYVGDESEVVVPETINDVWVSRIVEGTFKGEQFTKITIPAGLDYLGWNAIYDCPNLTEIAVSGEGCYFVVDNMLLYKGPRVGDDGVRLVYVPDGTTGDVIVPDVVTDIGADSFDNCVGVTSVYIPSSVTSSSEFGGSGSYDSAFTNCTNLTTIYGYAGSCAETIASNNNIEFVNLFVTPYFYCNETDDGNLTIKKYYGKVSNVVIPETINGKTVVGIENNSFYWVNLQSLYIPKTIKYIDEMAFRGLNLLSSVSVSDESTSFVVINGLLYTKDKTALVLTTCAVSGDVVVPEGVNTLYGSCFQSRTGITSITLPSTLKEINTFSFRDMSITSIVIPNGVEEIDEYAFFQSKNLSNVIIPSSVTTISDGAFEECTSLTSIVIPDSVTEISETAFKNSGLTTIYGYAGSCAETIASNNGFEFVSYSEGLKFTSNGNGTCYVSGIGTCTDTEIIIPPTSPAGDAVTSIGRNAFFYHGSLTNIFIPSRRIYI